MFFRKNRDKKLRVCKQEMSQPLKELGLTESPEKRRRICFAKELLLHQLQCEPDERCIFLGMKRSVADLNLVS